MVGNPVRAASLQVLLVQDLERAPAGIGRVGLSLVGSQLGQQRPQELPQSQRPTYSRGIIAQRFAPPIDAEQTSQGQLTKPAGLMPGLQGATYLFTVNVHHNQLKRALLRHFAPVRPIN